GGDTTPLTLASVGRPVQGGTAVPWEVTTSNIEAGALFHVGVLGLTSPMLPLGGLGFPASCTLYAAADILIGPAVVAGGPGTLTWTALNLPAAPPSFAGFEIYVQGVTLDLSLLSGTARTSNGIKGTVGDL
ncbi:MAG: hypothetical protein ACI91B_004899, partial [Planctomycetota bacterium]